MIFSLYDYTTIAVQPWAKDHVCYCVDIQHPPGFTEEGNIVKVGMTVEEFLITKLDLPDFIMAFPPCTDLAVSGARHFASKKLANPMYRKEAMNLVYVVRNYADEFCIPYYIENPVSVISTEWRKPNYIFSPNQYGGYLPEDDIHPYYPDYIPPRDGYNKRTCLWTNNGFVMPPKKEIEVLGYSTMYKKLGGKSIKTKNIRSATPRGFSQAVWEYNKE